MMADVQNEKNGSSSQTPPLCRFHAQGKHCRFGNKCRFLHQAPVSAAALKDISASQPADHKHTRTRAAPAPRPCRYFLSGHCSMEDRCRFLHPAVTPPIDDTLAHNPQPRNPQHQNPQPRNPQHQNPQPRNPQHQNPQPRDPQHKNPQPRNPQHQNPQHQNPQPRNPQHQNPQPRNPQHQNPQPRDPQHKNPQPRNPQHQNPQHQNPQPRNPQHQNPQHQNPQPRNPQHQNPQHQNPQHQNPQHQNPQPRNPQHQNPQPRNPQHQNPQPRDPQHKNPQPRNPQPQNPQPRDPQPRDPQPRDPQPRDPQPRDPQPRNLQPRGPPARGPDLSRDLKLSELTEEMVQKLRLTEIQQLKKRFPKDLIVQEQQDKAYYRAAVVASDPDWPFDLKEVDIMVSFPDNYPEEIFTLEIPLDQQLPQVMARHVQEASVQWLRAKHATNQLLGKVELLFRPFLRWLDRSLERLFIEGAKQLKRDMDLEKAGLQFISYKELQTAVSEKQAKEEESGRTEEQAEQGEEAESQHPEEEEEEGEDEDGVHLVENIRLQDRPKGTEIQLLGLRLGHNTVTVMTQKITACLRCNRCKVSAELSLSRGAQCSAQCEKCSSDIRAAFTAAILHPYSTVLGYLQLHNTTALDLLLNRCLFSVGCLSCSQDTAVENLSYGLTKEFNCEHCHEKLSIMVESARFLLIQARTNTGPSTNTVHLKNIRDPAVVKGKPLPDKGICKHYRQSHRWLRFPCCGRVYPCDLCHDADQDHPMELATRMICGFCAKEQPEQGLEEEMISDHNLVHCISPFESYGNGKPCVSCGGMMTRAARSCHWEGGQGCRSKVRMCRNDRQKYANTNKTISRKAASEK